RLPRRGRRPRSRDDAGNRRGPPQVALPGRRRRDRPEARWRAERATAGPRPWPGDTSRAPRFPGFPARRVARSAARCGRAPRQARARGRPIRRGVPSRLDPRRGLKPALPAQDGTMFDPGLNRHEWESEMASLEEYLHDDPGGALSELDDLVSRMLEETGYDVADPVVREGEEREIVAEFVGAREIKEAYERRA